MITEHLVHGLMIGAIIAFVAIGYSLIYSILKFINFAHGEVMMLGAYLCYVFYSVLQIEPFAVCVVLSIFFTGIIGVVIEKVAYKPLRQKGRLSMLLSSFGVSIALQAAISLTFGSSPLVYGVKDPVISLIGFPFYIRELLVILFLFITFVVVSFALRRTKLGLSVRAISTNPTRVALLGIPINTIVSTTFFIASALAAVAGISLAVEYGLTPSMGFQYSIWAFAVAVIAGLGSIRGIFIAGVLLGIIISFAFAYGSSLFANAVALGIMSLILLVRPQGFFVYKHRVF